MVDMPRLPTLASEEARWVGRACPVVVLGSSDAAALALAGDRRAASAVAAAEAAAPVSSKGASMSGEEEEEKFMFLCVWRCATNGMKREGKRLLRK